MRGMVKQSSRFRAEKKPDQQKLGFGVAGRDVGDGNRDRGGGSGPRRCQGWVSYFVDLERFIGTSVRPLTLPETTDGEPPWRRDVCRPPVLAKNAVGREAASEYEVLGRTRQSA
jgi:hypothetical protein